MKQTDARARAGANRFRCRGYGLCAALLLAACMGQAAAGVRLPPGTEPLEADKAFSVTARHVNDKSLELRFAIADGHYLYRDRFRFLINGQPVLLPKQAWPAGKWQQDATFGKVVTYRNSVHLLLPVSLTFNGVAQSDRALSLTVSSQGCADAGICYPPLQQALILAPGSSAWVGPQAELSSGFGHGGRQSAGPTDRVTSGK